MLKAEAEDIEQGHEGLTTLIENMWETMYEADGGVGCASGGIVRSLFVCDGSPFAEGDEGDPGCEGFKRVMINPVLFDPSDEQTSMHEGCSSIPDPKALSAQNPFRSNTTMRSGVGGRTPSGVARIVQHENDHLDGVLITDHTAR